MWNLHLFTHLSYKDHDEDKAIYIYKKQRKGEQCINSLKIESNLAK